MNLNLKVMVLSLSILVIVGIGILVFFRYVKMEIGVITSIITLCINFIPLLDRILKPKVKLEIKNVRFYKKAINGVGGYQLRAIITNKGKKICYNLQASVDIKNSKGYSPKLLKIEVKKVNGHKDVSFSESELNDAKCVFVDEKNRLINQESIILREKDKIWLKFPHIYSVSFALLDRRSLRSRSYHSYYLLKLEPDKKYEVTISIKGEDSDKSTITKEKKVKLAIKDS